VRGRSDDGYRVACFYGTVRTGDAPLRTVESLHRRSELVRQTAGLVEQGLGLGNQGLGLGIARKLTEAGYCAIAVARKESDQLKSAMEEAGRSNPGSLRFVPFDLSEIENIPGLVRALRRAGPSSRTRLSSSETTKDSAKRRGLRRQVTSFRRTRDWESSEPILSLGSVPQISQALP